MSNSKQNAEELVDKYRILLQKTDTEVGEEILCTLVAKSCALIAVNNIIASNPHSNPLNTEVYSTMSYWLEVKQEICDL